MTFEEWFDVWDQTGDSEIRRLCKISWDVARIDTHRRKPMRLTCPKCKNTVTVEIDSKIKYCYLDGEVLVRNRSCSCGKELSVFDRYCEWCGKAVERNPLEGPEEHVEDDGRNAPYDYSHALRQHFEEDR